jgi:hypothetical protein
MHILIVVRTGYLPECWTGLLRAHIIQLIGKISHTEQGDNIMNMTVRD